jgi:hypothetical protein
VNFQLLSILFRKLQKLMKEQGILSSPSPKPRRNLPSAAAVAAKEFTVVMRSAELCQTKKTF